MIYENKPSRPGYVPFPEPHHTRQPYPAVVPPHYASDLEPAFVVRPGEECCPGSGEDCVCVTSGDAIRWDHAADILDNLTEEELSALPQVTAFTNIAESADLWNGWFNDGSANSAKWNEISGLSSLSSFTNTKFDEIASAFEKTNSDLSAVADSIPNYHFDTSGYRPSMSGDGSEGAPFGVNGWQSYANVRAELNDLYTHIIKVPASDGYPERLIFDGTSAFVEETHTNFDMMIDWQNQQDLSIHHLNEQVSALSDSAISAVNGIKTYTPGYGILINRSHIGPRDWVVSLDVTQLPYVIADQVEEIATKTTNTVLAGKRYVEFVKLAGGYPKSSGDIVNATATKTIYVAV